MSKFVDLKSQQSNTAMFVCIWNTIRWNTDTDAICVSSSSVKAQGAVQDCFRTSDTDEEKPESTSQTARPITAEAHAEKKKVKVSVCASISQASVSLQSPTPSGSRSGSLLKTSKEHAAARHAATCTAWGDTSRHFVSDQPVCTLRDCTLAKWLRRAAICSPTKRLRCLNLNKAVICGGSQSKSCRSKDCGKKTAVTSGWNVYKAVWHRLCKHLGHQSVGSLPSVSE